jgi:hypothetical protein
MGIISKGVSGWQGLLDQLEVPVRVQGITGALRAVWLLLDADVELFGMSFAHPW